MEREKDEELLKIVNDSGFPFQLKIAREIDFGFKKDSHGWQVIAEEFRWLDPNSQKENYIDLVIEKSIKLRGVIECKKVGEQGDWIFIIDSVENRLSQKTRIFSIENKSPYSSEWIDLPISPGSPLSTFSVVRGQGGDRPMLENIASNLTRSLEQLANFEARYVENNSGPAPKIYIPIIVTNAKLFSALFNPNEVNLETGHIEQKNVKFFEEKYIRFEKSLSTYELPKVSPYLNLLSETQNRTVFIVNSTNINDFLRDFRFLQSI